MKTQTLSEEIQNPLNIFGRTRPKAYIHFNTFSLLRLVDRSESNSLMLDF